VIPTVRRLPVSLLRSLALAALLGSCTYEIRQPEPVTTEQIIQMTQEGKPPEFIIERIRSSGTVYRMTAKDVVELDQKGVDRKVIDEMLDTERRAIERRAYHDYYWHSYPYYYPYPGPFYYHGYYGPWWCW
jgi:hypothetical protein